MMWPSRSSRSQPRQAPARYARSRWESATNATPRQSRCNSSKGNSQGGFDQVGTLTQPVPVTTGKATTSFAFSYTFTPSDAAVGKVTFEAIATIQGARDALPTQPPSINNSVSRVVIILAGRLPGGLHGPAGDREQPAGAADRFLGRGKLAQGRQPLRLAQLVF